MKKFLVVVLIMGMVMGFLSCKARNTGSSKDLVAVSLPNLDNPLMLGIADAIRAAFPDQTVEVASAGGDPNTQATQIQNYVTMGAKLLVVMPAEASSLATVLKDARSKGVKVVVNGAKMEEGVYDVMASVNQYLVGQYCSLMAKEWIDENFRNAGAGTIETLILSSSLNEDAIARANGIISITERYRKNVNGEYVDADNNVVSEANRVENPVYCPQVKVVETTDAEMFQASQVVTENALTKNPNIRLVLCYTADGASGANQVFMDRSISAEGLKQIGVFGCGLIGPEEENLRESSRGGGVFRGAIAFGGADLPGEMAALAKKVYSGGEYEADQWDPIAKVYALNGEITRMIVNNTGAVQAD